MAPYTPADAFCGVYTILVSAVWEFFLSRHLDRFWDWVFGLFSHAPPPSSSSPAPGPDWEGQVRLLEARLEQTRAQHTEAKTTITAWECQAEVAEARLEETRAQHTESQAATEALLQETRARLTES